MEQLRTTGGEARENITTNDPAASVGLDAQFAELIETVWACERDWALDDRVAAALKYGR